HSLESLRPSAVLFEQLSNPRPGHVVERQLGIHRVSAAEFRTAVSLYGRVRQVRIKCEVRPPPSRIGRQGQAAERLSVGRNARRGHIGIQIAEQYSWICPADRSGAVCSDLYSAGHPRPRLLHIANLCQVDAAAVDAKLQDALL